MPYDIDFVIANEIIAHKRSFLLYPKDWEEANLTILILIHKNFKQLRILSHTIT